MPTGMTTIVTARWDQLEVGDTYRNPEAVYRPWRRVEEVTDGEDGQRTIWSGQYAQGGRVVEKDAPGARKDTMTRHGSHMVEVQVSTEWLAGLASHG